jgi:hypothetical protein
MMCDVDEDGDRAANAEKHNDQKTMTVSGTNRNVFQRNRTEDGSRCAPPPRDVDKPKVTHVRRQDTPSARRRLHEPAGAASFPPRLSLGFFVLVFSKSSNGVTPAANIAKLVLLLRLAGNGAKSKRLITPF